jgi:hypothetical protein
MNRKLGAFTCYGIEDVFDFLGENRIHQRIKELEGKPTMGITLNDFTYGDPEFSYFSGTGVLNAFSTLLEWFNDSVFLEFLYQNSKKYDEFNYFNGGFLKRKWNEHVSDIMFLLNRSPDKKLYCDANIENPYWHEYHFFYQSISKMLKMHYREGVNVQSIREDLIRNYLVNFKNITNGVRIANSPYPKTILANGFMWDAFDYYESKGLFEDANSVALLNNQFSDVWREIPIEEE